MLKKSNLLKMAVITAFLAIMVAPSMVSPLTYASGSLANPQGSTVISSSTADLGLDSAKIRSSTSAANEHKTISWNLQNSSDSDTYSWNQSSWEFGPTPSYELKYANGTEIGQFDALQLGSVNQFIVDIRIPRDALHGADLGRAGFYLGYYLSDPSNPTDSYSVNLNVNWVNFSGTPTW